MNLPIAFLLGVAVLLLAETLYFVLPGSGTVLSALLALPAIAAPALLAKLAVRRVVRRRRRELQQAARSAAARPDADARPDRLALLLLRLSVAAVPSGYAVLLIPGGWLDLADRWAGDSYVANLCLLLGPLLVADGGRHAVEALAGGRLGDRRVASDLRARLAVIGLFVVPGLLLAAAGDLASTSRHLFVFAMGTSVGLTLVGLAFLAALGLLLPIVFRALFGLRSRFPDPALGEELRETAAALGFPRRAVLWFDSGMRAVNALLLGPLPWPRYLVVTDGLMSALDVEALRGVVAHEVGHAQAGHPMMLLALFVVTPLLATSALQGFDGIDFGEGQLLLVALAFGAAVLWLLRRVAHRFEHEADVLSAIALGGAEPCIRALQRVGHVIQQSPERGSMLHPSEARRVRLLRSFAEDPQFRARFALGGLRLRRAIGVTVVVALLGAGWAWLQAWPLEQAALRFLLGDLRGARQQVEAVGADVPAGRWHWWQQFREDLDAAVAIAGDGGPWEELRPRFGAEGWRRGIEALRAEGPAVARRWFSLATESEDRPALRASVLLYCEAASAEDFERQSLLAAHIRALGPPPELGWYFGG